VKHLKESSLLLIFAYAAAGLGHLRVLDALVGGLPKGIKSEILGSEDQRIAALHRFASIHPITKAIMEWFQQGRPEDIFTAGYRFYLRRRGGMIFRQLEQILTKRKTQAKSVLVVATHFGLAHQIAAIKDKLMAELGIKIYLVVQVTDDSPQHLWFVPGADLTFVPSQKTKDELIFYGQQAGLSPVKIEVNPYPISPVLTREYNRDDFKKKIDRLNFFSQEPINVTVPISGAAVGIEFSRQLVKRLAGYSPRFKFLIVSNNTPYTRIFLSRMEKYPAVKTFLAKEDRKTVDNYDQVFKENLINLEITKPSEQAFKAILAPDKVGGVILLFSAPVGRQEKDNMDFLRRHQFLPPPVTQSLLEKTLLEGKETNTLPELLKEASRWRSLMLPKHPAQAAEFVFQCLKQGVFEEMMKFKFSDDQSLETRHDGVARLWESVSSIVVSS
jgi:hypothetical protein